MEGERKKRKRQEWNGITRMRCSPSFLRLASAQLPVTYVYLGVEVSKFCAEAVGLPVKWESEAPPPDPEPAPVAAPIPPPPPDKGPRNGCCS